MPCPLRRATRNGSGESEMEIEKESRKSLFADHEVDSQSYFAHKINNQLMNKVKFPDSERKLPWAV